MGSPIRCCSGVSQPASPQWTQPLLPSTMSPGHDLEVSRPLGSRLSLPFPASPSVCTHSQSGSSLLLTSSVPTTSVVQGPATLLLPALPSHSGHYRQEDSCYNASQITYNLALQWLLGVQIPMSSLSPSPSAIPGPLSSPCKHIFWSNRVSIHPSDPHPGTPCSSERPGGLQPSRLSLPAPPCLLPLLYQFSTSLSNIHHTRYSNLPCSFSAQENGNSTRAEIFVCFYHC